MTVQDVLLHYERRFSEAQAGIAQARLHSASAVYVLAIATAFLLILGVYAIRNQISLWWPSASVPVAAVSARFYRKRRQAALAMARVKRLCEHAIERVHGKWIGDGVSGDEFDHPDHPFARDLDIFGRGSLFELLCTVRSGVGKRGLAGYLTNLPRPDETLARQRAVAELRHQTALREKIALLGSFEFSDSNPATFDEWLDAPPVAFHPALRVAIFISSLLLASLFLACFAGPLTWIQAMPWIAPLIAFHCTAGGMLRGRVVPMIDAARSVAVETALLREGLGLLEEQRFESAKLLNLSNKSGGASQSLRKLERLLNALSERRKEWFYYPFLFLMIGTQLCMAMEQWRTHNRSALRAWLDAWAEFEALNALACYAYENPDATTPELCESELRFSAHALAHPLLPREAAVPNDIDLNDESRFYIVSGSNMSGKSTLLRAIGLNLVLARVGAPVRAAAFRVSSLAVCASISIVDSLLNGKSKFMAEIDRIRRAIDLSAQQPVLFLIDEILSGTNSRDRRVASEAILRTLVDRGAIGALSTHDLALTEIAADLGGVNVNMGSRSNGGPLDFDYRLKPGVTTETNALAIARMAGVPI